MEARFQTKLTTTSHLNSAESNAYVKFIIQKIRLTEFLLFTNAFIPLKLVFPGKNTQLSIMSLSETQIFKIDRLNI
jgi:hypothetical protein